MAKFKNNTAIAFAETYFDSCKKLPANILRDEMTFREKFTKDPSSPGLNYERINAADSSLRSVRVNGAYRAIVKTPGKDTPNVYTLLWVDSHDEAYAWAGKKRFAVNPVSNVVEIYNVVEKDEALKTPPPHAALFKSISDADLKRLGIDEPLIRIIRKAASWDTVEDLKSYLPKPIFESLAYLQEGIPIEEILETVESSGSSITSFEEAVLSGPNSEQFFIVDSDEKANELSRIMQSPLEQWRIFLHPKQNEIATKWYDGPAQVLGGAGTGKTVIAMHRAKWLAETQAVKSEEKVLFTTFTSSLADDIRSNLMELCTDKVRNKIEVINLDKWVHQFLLKYHNGWKIMYGQEIPKMWQKVIPASVSETDIPADFYISEYEKVILANDIETLEQYLTVRRTGRGIRLNRKQKVEMWNVFEHYRQQCADEKVLDPEAAMLKAKKIIEKDELRLPYRYVIIDEGQDLGDPAYRLLRAIAGDEKANDIFIVGDAHQQIYGRKVVLLNCGININGRQEILKLNYRTTDEIRRFASSLVTKMSTEDPPDGTGNLHGYVSVTHGKEPVISKYSSQKDEYEAVEKQLKQWIEGGIKPESICIVARLNKQLESIKRYLAEKSIDAYEIKPSKAEDRTNQGIRLSSMHRVKGLEFDCVLIIDLNDGVLPLNSLIDSATDLINQKELINSEQRLLYVAATRAKKELAVMSYGKPSRLLD